MHFLIGWEAKQNLSITLLYNMYENKIIGQDKSICDEQLHQAIF